VIEPLQAALAAGDHTPNSTPRQRYVLEETGFNEVPKKYRKFYRRFGGEGDTLAPNEVLCPVCMVVVRSSRELRAGDRVYCMPCFSRLIVVETNGRLEAQPVY
jgi:hypothetical protein